MRPKGFTLIEILIALFIFSILALIVTSALKTAINAQSNTEKHAARLTQLQIALTLLSRDLEQSISRPIINVTGANEVAFLGTKQSITFTHAGLSNPLEKSPRSTLQRVSYRFEKNRLLRETWSALDLSRASEPLRKVILNGITQANFEYLDNDERFQNRWPPAGQNNNSEFPRAVRMVITLRDLGKMEQLYVIPVQPPKNQKPH